MALDQLHIASLVVHVAPRRLESVLGKIGDLPGALVHASSANGKLVVTLEVPSADAMTAGVQRIQPIDGVLSAALVCPCAGSLEAMNEGWPMLRREFVRQSAAAAAGAAVGISLPAPVHAQGAGSDPDVKAGAGYQFHGFSDGRARIYAVPTNQPLKTLTPTIGSGSRPAA